MYELKDFLCKIKIEGDILEFREIQPYVRFARHQLYDMRKPVLCPYDCRLFYVEEGSAEITADGTTYTLSSGDVILIAPGIVYRVAPENDKTNILAFNFDYVFSASDLTIPVPPDSPEVFEKQNIIAPVTFSDLTVFNRAVCLRDMSMGHGFLEQAHEEYKKNLLFSDTLAGAYFGQFLALCARRLADPTTETGATATDRIISYLHKNYCKNITNEYLAKEFNYHPNYISSLIRAKTGMSLHRYFLYIRVRRAISLLETTDLSVTEIAQKVGFCDVSYFSNYFRKVTGRAPKYYRKK